MSNYLSTLNDETQEYFKILTAEYPLWLDDYIFTKEMQRLKYIGISCGMDYAGSFKNARFYSNLEHSVGSALIVWNFTKSKEQTLAALFHDIACPAFKHCIDFLHGDHENQEATEYLTEEIIVNSKDIRNLLKRDNINFEEVIDYKMYPIADNETPRLSSDRLEYTFSSGLNFFRVWDLDIIKKTYDDLTILINEDGIEEIGFKNLTICENYIDIASTLWPKWISTPDKVSMQFIADIIKVMINRNYLSLEDLYKLKESEIVAKILNCPDTKISDAFKLFQEKEVSESQIPVENKYCVSINSKTRYVNPLVKTNDNVKRISEISYEAKMKIDAYSNNKTTKYGYIDLCFNPNEYVKKYKK
ncbi:MAG: hypothetical protein GX864_04780 [Mollicutes bacterium]|jgi:HD superfamily phosphohydrolase|nr:hypothetical protein [Mollicutes bacterium]